MKTTLLIATYNWPQALNVVLISVLAQSVMPDEILIADDGSTEETKLLVAKYKNQFSIPIHHLWQEDVGFRKAKILNKSIASSACQYIIQIDGDCILHPKFIEDHKRAAEKGVYLYGSRVNILPEAVNIVLKKSTTTFNIFSKEIKNKTRTLHFSIFSNFYRPHNGISKKFRGCNVSFWRDDFIRINGYNEDFEGWGREDSDLAIRLGNNNVKAKRLRYAGILYHLHHKINSKGNFEVNDKMQRETIANKTVHISNGINQYLI